MLRNRSFTKLEYNPINARLRIKFRKLYESCKLFTAKQKILHFFFWLDYIMLSFYLIDFKTNTHTFEYHFV